MEDQHYQNGLASSEQDAELSDVELLRRAITYSRASGFGIGPNELVSQ